MSTNQSINYSNYSFEDMVVRLQNRLAQKDAWKDIYRSSTGEMLIELLAYVLEQGMFYTERRAQESFLSTAQLRSSLVNMVSLINYTPKRKSSATGTLTFTLASPASKIVYIPKYLECQTSDGIKFLTNEAGTIEKLQSTITLKGIQGELVEKEITTDGSLNQEYFINDTDVENSADAYNPTFTVSIDGEAWTKVSSFIDSDNNDKVYRIINEMAGEVSVKFGDNINGAAPENGSTLIISYVRSEGSEGNVSFTDMVTTINDTVYDADSAVVENITVTNNALFLGGDDEESIEEIRNEAPRVFATGDRAVSKADFSAILDNYPGVADSNVWGENEEAALAGVPAVASMLNTVKMSVVLQNWEEADSTFQTTLGDYLYNISMLTVKYEWVDPSILTVIPRLWIKVMKGESLSETQTEIEQILVEQFTLGETTKLGTVVQYSTILSAIQELDAVAYANMVLEVEQELSDSYNSIYDFGGLLKATEIEPGTCRLFYGSDYIVSDIDQGDGTGKFTASGGTYTIAGTVDYSTGEVLLDSSPTPSGVSVRYQQAENGNIVPTFNEICKLSDSGGNFESIAIVS